MQVVLEGTLLTPMIGRKTIFYLHECQVSIINVRRRYYSKITVSKPMYPFSYIGYLGNLVVVYKCKSISDAQNKLLQLLHIESIGRFTTEGLGKVQWLKGKLIAEEISQTSKKTVNQHKKIKIRKGLPHNLPAHVQELIRYGLLHDLYHTRIHQSKMYVEPPLEDKDFMEQLRKHHDHADNPLINTFKKYDRLAALITRKHRSPTVSRYTWKSVEKEYFVALAQRIAGVATNVWKLYDYIYKSKELEQLNESLEFGHSSLRFHLVLIANLLVQDYINGLL